MYWLIRPFLFRLDPERAHNLTLTLLKWAGQSPISNLLRAAFVLHDPRLEVEAFGLRFKNPVGLAAGYDKNGIAVRGLSGLGFGHVEIGTVTRQPQMGNPRPRIRRVPEAGALVNSMGFPNAGVEALKVERGRPSRPGGPGCCATARTGWNVKSEVRVGINIGKGKDTPLEKAADDYYALLRQVHGRADYVALNVSSPNTLGLRQLQGREFIEDLLRVVAAARDELPRRVPLLVKVAPDLAEAEVDDVLAAIAASDFNGVIATNTTVSREGAPAYAAKWQGGLSGQPLKARATEVIRYIARRTGGRLPIIGVGGIASAADALEKLRAGAWLVQVYTGLVYAGPGLVRQINEGLLHACELEGANSVSELSSALIEAAR